MDVVKICLNTQDNKILPLKVDKMIEDDGILTITLNGVYNNLSVNNAVTFTRMIKTKKSNANSVVDTYTTYILTVDTESLANKTIITIVPPQDIQIYIDTLTENNGLYKVNCFNNHNIFAQDLLSIKDLGLKFYVYNKINDSKDFVCKTEDILISEANTPILQEYFIFNQKLVNSYNCDDIEDYYELKPNFYYVDNYTNMQVLYFTNLLCERSKLVNAFFAPYNSFYYRDSNNRCYFWNDFDGYEEIGESITSIGNVRCKYISLSKEDTYSNVEFFKNDNTYKISVGLSENSDYKHLYQEGLITEEYSKKVKEAVVDNAPVIDMEKVKFSPYVVAPVSGNDGKLASKLIFNLHFRTRTDLNNSWRYDTGSTYYWNGISNYNYVKLNPNDETVRSSDMLYYLGFTDSDVKNQKSKIKKSFIRLSFYDDINPLTQKLLYFSTIYMDSGSLFGKYVKAYSELKKTDMEYNNVVLSSSALSENRLDCKFVIEDEFYTEKSSEGFNIYYFPDEIINAENSEKTIYMKVEFNHAGFGRTIPMIACGSENSLSIKNYKDKLYIKLKLIYFNNKYCYVIDDTDSCIIKDTENATIEFNLFEPKLDAS